MGQRTFIIVGQTTLYFPVFINQLKSRNLAARTIDEGAIDENGEGRRITVIKETRKES